MLGYAESRSAQDASVNWDRPAGVGRIEARYVRRCAGHVVVYLSSQTGCAQGCRMCHLTATGQTALRDVARAEYLEQADAVLGHCRTQEKARSVHFNFMARGEPLANPHLLGEADGIPGDLAGRAVALGLRPRWLVSTIIPKEFGERRLEDVFVVQAPEVYYSLYSMDERFRRRWLPKALPAAEGLDRLASWQRASYKLVKLHHAYIGGRTTARPTRTPSATPWRSGSSWPTSTSSATTRPASGTESSRRKR
ncbi:MAG: hypothetical protein K2W96_27410 [Gemmataceae bacterium]|nr:hypothetical protein [Gemmataceae bacterium]